MFFRVRFASVSDPAMVFSYDWDFVTAVIFFTFIIASFSLRGKSLTCPLIIFDDPGLQYHFFHNVDTCAQPIKNIGKLRYSSIKSARYSSKVHERL